MAVRPILLMTAKSITSFIDLFYPLVKRWIPVQLYRYGVCGAGNMCFEWVLYFLLYNFVVGHENVDFGWVVVSPHILTLCITFPITLSTGFFLAKYVTFKSSSLAEASQWWRYLLVWVVNLLINYSGIKVLVEEWGFYPTPSKMLLTFFTVILSYICQRYFTFKE